MPDCSKCKYLAGEVCKALPSDWPLVPVNKVRACTVAITNEYCSLINSGMRVLEIGCGTWSPIRDHCRQVSAEWEGIDIQESYYGKPTIATRIESVEELSFPDESFDFVIANQSLEHWQEFGTRPELGLWHCFRVCKVGGLILMNVPIHHHGSPDFLTGNLDAIADMFQQFADKVVLETWRRNSAPLEPVYLAPKWLTGGEGTYVLDIKAVRSPKLPPRPKPFKIRLRLIRELLDHRLDYLGYKALRRARIQFHKILTWR